MFDVCPYIPIRDRINHISKIERMVWLYRLGFNIPLFYILPSGHKLSKEDIKVLRSIHYEGNVGIRCFTHPSDLKQLPLYLDNQVEDALIIADQVLREDEYGIIWQAPPKVENTKAAGMFLVDYEGNGCYDVIYGPYFVRDSLSSELAIHGNIPIGCIGLNEPIIHKAIKYTKDLQMYLKKEEALCVEFAVFNKPFGFFNDYICVWEYEIINI